MVRGQGQGPRQGAASGRDRPAHPSRPGPRYADGCLGHGDEDRRAGPGPWRIRREGGPVGAGCGAGMGCCADMPAVAAQAEAQWRDEYAVALNRFPGLSSGDDGYEAALDTVERMEIEAVRRQEERERLALLEAEERERARLAEEERRRQTRLAEAQREAESRRRLDSALERGIQRGIQSGLAIAQGSSPSHSSFRISNGEPRRRDNGGWPRSIGSRRSNATPSRHVSGAATPTGGSASAGRETSKAGIGLRRHLRWCEERYQEHMIKYGASPASGSMGRRRVDVVSALPGPTTTMVEEKRSWGLKGCSVPGLAVRRS